MIDFSKTEPQEGWLSLREASRQMGVSPQTLRAWANEGRVPIYRTPGGHRRFRVAQTEFVTPTKPRRSDTRWRLLEHSVLGQIRMALENSASDASGWQNAGDGRNEYRALGRSLISLLVQALSKETNDAGTRADALGQVYAELHQRMGMDHATAIAALGFFRNAFVASLVEFAFGLGEPNADQLASWLRRTNELIDRVAVSMLQSGVEQNT